MSTRVTGSGRWERQGSRLHLEFKRLAIGTVDSDETHDLRISANLSFLGHDSLELIFDGEEEIYRLTRVR